MPTTPPVHDPDLYQLLSTPRPREVCSTALGDFMDDVLTARIKHGIADVIVMGVARSDEDDAESDPALICQYGNSANAVGMAAFLLRRFREQAEEASDAAIEAASRPAKRQKTREVTGVSVLPEQVLETLPEDVRKIYLDARAEAVKAMLPSTLADLVLKTRFTLPPGRSTRLGILEEGARAALQMIGAVEKDGIWTCPADASAPSVEDLERFTSLIDKLAANAERNTLSSVDVVRAMSHEALRATSANGVVEWSTEAQAEAEKTARKILHALDDAGVIRLNKGHPELLTEKERAICPTEDGVCFAEVVVKPGPTAPAETP